MDSKPHLQSNTVIIHEALEEIHTLLSALETKIKLELFPAQAEETAEVTTPEEPLIQKENYSITSVLKDDFCFADWL